MKDWEAIKLLDTLIDKVENESPPNAETPDIAEGIWQGRQWAHSLLLSERKPYVDRVYQAYLDKGRKPWCDACGGPAVLSEVEGWKHSGFLDPWVMIHKVTLQEYNAGWNAEIIKRLSGEIE
jgi:hypothetical protein